MHPTPFSALTILLLPALVLLPLVVAHGGHDRQQPLGEEQEEADWATRHMAGMFSLRLGRDWFAFRLAYLQDGPHNPLLR